MENIASVIRRVKYVDDFKKVEIDNFEPICALKFLPYDSDIVIKICVDLNLISAYVNASENIVDNFYDVYEGETITEEDIPLTFFDYFGAGPHFKTLFRDIKDATVYSKKEVSQLLRSDIICEKAPKYNMVYFEFSIPRDKIKNPK